MEIGYRTPNTICFTRPSNDSLETIRRYDRLDFDRSIFENEKYQNVELKIFVHYPQQLLRSFHKPVFRSTLGEQKNDNKFWSNLYTITISDITVLKTRPGSNFPCDQSLLDDDVKLQNQIMEKIRCIPIYWKSVVEAELQLEICNSTDDLNEAYYHIQHYRKMFSTYNPPCIEMKVFSRFDKEDKNRANDPRILFQYSEEMYQEIMGTEDFGFESFLSGVGGFVGIFLGYSILQLPELLTLIDSFSRVLKKHQYTGRSI